MIKFIDELEAMRFVLQDWGIPHNSLDTAREFYHVSEWYIKDGKKIKFYDTYDMMLDDISEGRTYHDPEIYRNRRVGFSRFADGLVSASIDLKKTTHLHCLVCQDGCYKYYDFIDENDAARLLEIANSETPGLAFSGEWSIYGPDSRVYQFSSYGSAIGAACRLVKSYAEADDYKLVPGMYYLHDRARFFSIRNNSYLLRAYLRKKHKNHYACDFNNHELPLEKRIRRCSDEIR